MTRDNLNSLKIIIFMNQKTFHTYKIIHKIPPIYLYARTMNNRVENICFIRNNRENGVILENI